MWSKIARIESRTDRIAESSLVLSIASDYHGRLPVAVKIDCFDQSSTPPLRVDPRLYGEGARLLNITDGRGSSCASFRVAAAQFGGNAAGGAVSTASSSMAIAVEAHHSGKPESETVGNPAVFVFNPVHGNWTEAKAHSHTARDPQKAYATLTEHHQRLIVGVIAQPDALQREPARNTPTSITGPIDQVSASDGYLAIDSIEPDNKGAYRVTLPLLLRPSRGPGPSFSISYSSQGAAGVLGRGWDLSISAIEVRGPAPIYHPEFETEDYVLDGMDLIPLDGKGADMAPLHKGGPIVRRVKDVRYFRPRNNSNPLIVRRYGDTPSTYFWELWNPNSHVTRLYGGKFNGNGERPLLDDDRNGLLLATAKFSGGVSRAVIGKWGLTQEYDNQPARTGASYRYYQNGNGSRADGRVCIDGLGLADCWSALRLKEVKYNQVFNEPLRPKYASLENDTRGETLVEFEWRPRWKALEPFSRDERRDNSDGRLGFLRAHQHWLKGIAVKYQPDDGDLWLASNAKERKSKQVTFSRHEFVLSDGRDPCMNYDVVLSEFKVDGNSGFDGIESSQEQVFRFNYDGEKYASSKAGVCAREWSEAEPVEQLGDLPADAPKGAIDFPKNLLKNLGFGLLTQRSLLGTGRIEETGASAYIGVGPADDTSVKPISGGFKGGYNFTKSETNSTLIDVTGDGIDDIVWRAGGGLNYCGGVRDSNSHFVTYPPDRCGSVEGISELALSSTSTFSAGAEATAYGSVFAGVGFSRSKNDTYIYFTHRDADGLIDLAAYGQVYYGQGETVDSITNERVVRFLPNSALTPPLPGGNRASEITRHLPRDLRETVLEIETRLEATARQLATLDYSQITLAWEAPLDGRVSLAGHTPPEGTFETGVADLATIPLGGVDPEFGPDDFKTLFDEVEAYKKYAYECDAWPEKEFCHRLYSDPYAAQFRRPADEFRFVRTFDARLRVSLSRRGPRDVFTCLEAELANGRHFEFGQQDFQGECTKENGNPKEIPVRTGDVIYLTYSVHPHFAKWLKPRAVVRYVAVDNDPAFAIAKDGDRDGIVEQLPCNWNLPNIAPLPVEKCALSQLSPYEFDLRAGALTTVPNRAVELAPGRERTFGGAFNIPTWLTQAYSVHFDILARQVPKPTRPGAVPGQEPGPVPIEMLQRVYRFDVSNHCESEKEETCRAALSPVCEAASPAKTECDMFVAAEHGHFAVASRLVVQHKVTGAEIDARNVDSMLKDVAWTRPPHIRTILTKLDPEPEGEKAPGVNVERYSLVYLPVTMGQEDIEYFRVESGVFDNPDVDMHEGDPQADLINFAKVMSLERETVRFTRIRQTLELCQFAKEIVNYLRDIYAVHAPPFADDYLDYWANQQEMYTERCATALKAYHEATFTQGHAPDRGAIDGLNLPVLLRNLTYVERISSAETLLQRVQASLALGDEFMTDEPRLTRRGYRLPLKVNPLDCDTLGRTDVPLEEPIVDSPGRSTSDCAYRLLANFAMEDFDRLIGKEKADNLRKILQPLSGSMTAAFRLELTATVNGRAVAFRELTGDETGNDPCTPLVPKTCIGTYGTTGSDSTGVKAYLHPKGRGIDNGPNPNDPTAGDVLQRLSTNKRSGRAVAFSNNIMSSTLAPKCERAHPLFESGWQMEAKQDCLFDGSDISKEGEKYKGPPAYTASYEITEGNRFLGRNRVLEFRAKPLDIVEFQIRIVPVERSIQIPGPDPVAGARGAFSILPVRNASGALLDGHLIPRSPHNILPDRLAVLPVDPRTEPTRYACPKAPTVASALWAGRLPSTCRPWSRIGWAELLLGAQYRTYSDAQKTGRENEYSIKRRREILRLQPELEVRSDRYLLEHTTGDNAILVSQIKNEANADVATLQRAVDDAKLPYKVEIAWPNEYMIFHRRDPNIAKTGGAWALFGNRAPRDGSLGDVPPFARLRFDTPKHEDPSQRPTDAYQKGVEECPEGGDPDFVRCEAYMVPNGQISLALEGHDVFALEHRFVGPVDGGPVPGSTADVLQDVEAEVRTGVGQCSVVRPNTTASCWKGPDDTVFLEEAVTEQRPAGQSRPDLYSVSALVGFERPPLVQFLFEFDSYKRLACLDPTMDRIKDGGLTLASILCPPRAAPPISGAPALAYPNRPDPPNPDATVPVYAPVQASTSRSVSRNTGALLYNRNSSRTKRQHTTAYMDVNGDGYPEVVGGGWAELTSPVGLSRRDWWRYFRVEENMPSLAPELVADGMHQNADSISNGEGIGLSPSTFAVFKQRGTGTNESGSPDAVLDPSFSLDREQGNDETFTELRDFNGDGLADQLTGRTVGAGLTLALNAGGEMVSAANSGQITVADSKVSAQPFNTNNSAGFGVRLGFSVESGSYGAGMGLAHRGAGSVGVLMDFTGDGRPDIVVPANRPGLGNLVVFPNLGNGFGGGRWHTIKEHTPKHTGFTETTLVDAGGFYTYGFKVWILKVVFNIGGKFTRGQTRELTSFRDINGDGFPDLATVKGSFESLSSEANAVESEVHYNPEARYHLLTEVTNPSGSRYLLSHDLYGNESAALGNPVWALTEVALYDGFEPRLHEAVVGPLADDGHDVSLTRYHYENGYFNRAERQFYGFARRIATTLGCDLASSPSCLDFFGGNNRLTMKQLEEVGYRKLQIVDQTFSNRDFFTQGMVLSQNVQGFESHDAAPAGGTPQAISTSHFGYTIDQLAHHESVAEPAEARGPANLLSGSWDPAAQSAGSVLPSLWNGSTFLPGRPLLGQGNLCDSSGALDCVETLTDTVLSAGFAREQQAFWAQQSGAARQRIESLEIFGGGVAPGEAARPVTPRLRSAVAFDHDQWGQVVGFNSIGEAASDWIPGIEASAHATVKYAARQGLNDPDNPSAGYPLLGLAGEVRIFGGGIPGQGGRAPPLRVRQALYSTDGRGNLTDVCTYPAAGLTITPELCATYKEKLRGHLSDGYSTLQTALRATYEEIDELPKGVDDFGAVLHHQLGDYDDFGNLGHAVSPLTASKEWVERRFSYTDDPFRRTATTVALTRCVEDIAGAGKDSDEQVARSYRCGFGWDALPEPVRRRAITHYSTARIDAHSGSVVETTDVNGNAILIDFDRWGRLRLIARGWGSAPRENRTFAPQLARAIAKSAAVTGKPEEVTDTDQWRILALADYEKVADGLLRSNLRRFDPADSYSGLLERGKTTRETALFADGNGRLIQNIREADVCVGVPDHLVDGGMNATVDGDPALPTTVLEKRCTATAKAIVTPASAIDALGRDLLSFESYPYDGSFERQQPSDPYKQPRLRALAAAPAKPAWLSRSTYDGAGRPTLVQSRLALEGTAPQDRVRGAAQYRYRVVSPAETGPRLARFEALTVSPRCSASAAWSDARGLTRTVFEQQALLYTLPSGAAPSETVSVPPLARDHELYPLAPKYERDHALSWGDCANIADVAESLRPAIEQSAAAEWPHTSGSADAASPQPARVSYAYDPLQQLTGVSYPLAGQARASMNVRYDMIGRMTELHEPNAGCTSYGYDPLNLLVAVKGFRFEPDGKPCGTTSRVANEKRYRYAADRLIEMSYRSLEEQGGAEDTLDTVRFYHDGYPHAGVSAELLEPQRYVPNDDANRRFVDVTGRVCDNCIGQVAVVADRTGARSFAYNALGLASREVRSIVAPLKHARLKHSEGYSENYLPEVSFHEIENSYTAFGDLVLQRLAESAPANPHTQCVDNGIETCLARFTIGRKYAPDGAVAELLFNGRPLISAAQDALGRPAIRWTADGTATGYRYDDSDLRLNQLATLTGAEIAVSGEAGAGALAVQVNGYQYDGGGNVLAYTNRAIPKEDYESAFGFGYDAVNRLTGFGAEVRKGEAQLKSSGSYVYDAGHRFMSRRLTITGEPGTDLRRDWTYSYENSPGAAPLHAPSRIQFSANDNGRDTLLAYDDIGRMTRIGAPPLDSEAAAGLLTNRALSWDAEGRLIRVRGVGDAAAEANAAWMREDYVYDSGGNRTLRIHRPRVDTSGKPLEDEEAAATATIYLTPFYAKTLDRRGTVQISQGTLPSASLDAPDDGNEAPVVTYVHSDLAVGSVTASVTAFGEAWDANSIVIARREYSPYGLELTADRLADTGRPGAAPLSVFHGKELDRVTNFSSFGARSYSRDMGIWLSPDPMMAGYLSGRPSGGVFAPPNLSSFAYAHLRPTVANDPDGKHPLLAIGIFVAVLAGEALLNNEPVDYDSGEVRPSFIDPVSMVAGGATRMGNLTSRLLGGSGRTMSKAGERLARNAHVGRLGEELGEKLLEKRGYEIVGRQMRVILENGEEMVIDRLAKKGGKFFAVETKTGDALLRRGGQNSFYYKGVDINRFKGEKTLRQLSERGIEQSEVLDNIKRLYHMNDPR